MGATSIISIALATRLGLILLAFACYWTGVSYDISSETETLFRQGNLYGLESLVRWDAVYFLGIAERGGYAFEHEFAFFPGLPLLMRSFYEVTKGFMPFLSKRTLLVLGGCIISNVTFVMAAVNLDRLGQVVLKNDSLARTAAILFCLNPCGIFMSSLYTESLFAFLSFYGMLLYVQNRLFLASLVWAAGSLSRANGIVYVGFFVWELLSERRRRYIGLGVYQIGFLVKLIVCSLIVIAPFALFQLFAYDAFCTRLPPSLVRPWCESKIPLIYSFVQKEYWNNGFLSYYEVKQIPNFLLAAPFLGLSILGLHSYYAYDPQRFWTLGLRSTKRINRQMRPYFSSSLLPFIYLWAAMTFLVSTMMHVQVILRFFTCLPPLYWFLAHFLVTPSKKTAMCSSGLLIYWVFYPLVGAVLFANFYPPA